MRKKWSTTFLLCLFVGMFGVHRFYVGKIRSGLLYALTFGFCGIGWIADLIQIVTESFCDEFDRPILIRNRRNLYRDGYMYEDRRRQGVDWDENEPHTEAGRSYREERREAEPTVVRRKTVSPAPVRRQKKRREFHITTILVGLVLALLCCITLLFWCEDVTAGNMLFGIPCIALGLLYVWFFILPKMFRETYSLGERDIPSVFNPFKSKEDIIVDKPEGRFLGYEETTEGMYAEHYEVMQCYNNLKFYLEDNPKARDFEMGKVSCRRFTGDDTPMWNEAFYMFDMSGRIIYMTYNDGSGIYTYKKGRWYVAELPEDEREPELAYMY